MSERATRRRSKPLEKSATPILKDDVVNLQNKKGRSIRRIRKTNELICFNTTIEPEKPSSPIVEKKLPLVAISEVKHKVSPETKTNASPLKGLKIEAVPSNLEKRKIIKAKRICKNEGNDIISQNTFEMVVKSLPSPISPSPNSTNNSPQNDHLKFDSSAEKLQPSTSGTVEVKRRQTYELEDSINDISLLKSASLKDSTCLSSFPSDKDSLEITPPPTDSKVTRRKWDKRALATPNVSKEAPSWLSENKISPSRLVTPVKNTKPSTTKKKSSKVKLPNFALIHQKALEKVESIAEYKARKDERAKRLLSGIKLIVAQKSTPKESRKQLRFAAGMTPKEKSPTFIPLPSTPMPKRKMSISGSPSPFKFKFDFVKENIPAKESHIPTNFLFNGTKQPTFVVTEKNPIVKDSPSIKKWTFKGIRSPKFGLNIPAKESHIPRSFHFNGTKQPTFVVTEKHPIVKDSLPIKKWTFKGIRSPKFGLSEKNPNIKEIPVSKSWTFKARNIPKKEIQSVIDRKKPIEDTRESRRCAIKGVRSNRRFDLLMNMRKGK